MMRFPTIKNIIQIGVDQKQEEFKVLRYQVINSIVFFSLVIIGISLILNYWMQNDTIFIYDIFCFVLIVPILYFNFKKWINFSRLYLLILFNISITLSASIFGQTFGLHQILFSMLILPFIFFSYEELKLLMLGLLPPILGFLYLYLTDFRPILDIKTSTPQWSEGVSTIIIIIFNSASLILLSRSYNRVINSLKEERLANLKASRLSTLGEVSASIAHEIRNPLAIIMGRAERLLSKIKSDQSTHDYLENGLKNIYETSIRMEKIVTSFQALSRDSNKDPMAPVSLINLIDQCLGLLCEKLKACNIELIQENIQDLQINGKESQLGQVLVNLLVNAIDAIDSYEKKWIKIKMTEDDVFLNLCVIDCGHGIPENIVKTIMEPFFTTKKVGKGTGLGLSIAARIMDEHGGKLIYELMEKNTSFKMIFDKNSLIKNKEAS